MRLTAPWWARTVAGPMRALDLRWAQWPAVSDPQPDSSGRPVERFPSSSRVFGLVTLAALAVVVVVVLVDDFGLTRVAIVAGVVLFGVGVWLTMVRPAVDLHKDHVLVRNALTDFMVPWHLIESVDVRQVLVIRTGERVVRGTAVGRSARQQLRRSRSGDGAGPVAAAGGAATTHGAPVFGGQGVVRVDYADVVAQRIDALVPAYRRDSERLSAVTKRWRRLEVAAVVGVTVAFGLLLTLAIAA